MNHPMTDEITTKNKSYPLQQLYFYLTSGCNLRCRHCWISPKFQEKGEDSLSIPLELFKSVVDQAVPMGLSTVKLTGGEPLLHPQIEAILDDLKHREIALCFETNGLLCSPNIALKISECKDAFVSVSLDGADAETHDWFRGVKGAFEGAVQGIKNLVEAKLHPQVIMCLMRRNQDQIEAMVRLAETLGAESVKFNLIQPTSRGMKIHEGEDALPIERLLELGSWVENELSRSTSLRLTYDWPLAFRSLSKMFGKSKDGCGTCGILGILGVLADGSYALCGIGESLPEMVFGHAATDSLENVWNKSDVLARLRSGLPEALEGVCAHCLMKLYCKGSCIAQNYYRTKNLWAPYWFCETAFEKGLFPASRMDVLSENEKSIDKSG